MPRTGLVGPAIAAVALILMGVLTAALFAGWSPLSIVSKGPGSSDNPGNLVNPTPAPSNVVIADPKANIPGSLVYVKAGNIFIQTAGHSTQLTKAGGASSPAWSSDGKWIYYIETIPQEGYFPQGNSGPARYTMNVPSLARISPDGATNQALITGRYRTGGYSWFFWLIDPAVSPDGKTVALFSDAPDPTRSDVVLQFFNVATRKLTKPTLAENPPYGHQDAAWRPDGKLLLYVQNGRDGQRGVPQIYAYNPATKRAAPFGAPGYMRPSWSPDGRWITVTRQTPQGTDIAILSGRTGAEVLRVTNDGSSWAPVWSPRGDAIAYLNIVGQIVDLKMVGLTGSAPAWTVTALPDVTEYSGLDASSGASWYIPPDQLPSPPPATPAPSPSGAATSPAPS
jgi:Tol biopolymer transport system component